MCKHWKKQSAVIIFMITVTIAEDGGRTVQARRHILEPGKHPE